MAESAVKTLDQLPDDVVSFLSDTKASDYTENFAKKYGLPEGGDVDLLLLNEDIATGVVPLSDLPANLEELGVPKEKAIEASIQFASDRVQPIAGVVGDVVGQIVEWGGSAEELKGQAQVVQQAVTAEGFVSGFLKESDVQIQDKIMHHRLELILISFVKGVRDENEAVSAMARAPKVGGLGMSEENARALIKTVSDKLSFIKVSFADEGAATELPSAKEKKKEGPVSKGKKVAVKVAKKVSEAAKVPPSPVAPQAPVVGAAPAPVAEPKAAPAPKMVVKEEKAPAVNPEEALKAVREKAAPKKRAKKAKKIETKPAAEVAKADLDVDKVAIENGKTAAKKVEKKKLAKVDTSILQKKAEKGLGADVFSDEDLKEVEAIAAKKKEVVSEERAPMADTNAVIARILKESGLKLKGEMKTRFEKAIDSRIRDVRDAYETRMQLESAEDKGGLGLSGAELAETSRLIEGVVGEYQRSVAAQAAKQKESALKQQQEEKAAQKNAAAAAEEQLMAKRYAQITGHASSEAVAPAAPTGARPSVAMPAKTTLDRQEEQIDSGKVKEVAKASAAKSKAVTPALSAGSIPASGGMRPKMQDVRFEKRLAGPIDELKNMSIVEFRRLSEDPVQAMNKVMGKVRLLEEQGFDKRIEAVKAWRASLLNAQYMQLAREALLSGKQIDQVIEEKAAAGEQVPTAEEIKVIVQLNADLRF